jgi:hypothetical protein
VLEYTNRASPVLVDGNPMEMRLGKRLCLDLRIAQGPPNSSAGYQINGEKSSRTTSRFFGVIPSGENKDNTSRVIDRLQCSKWYACQPLASDIQNTRNICQEREIATGMPPRRQVWLSHQNNRIDLVNSKIMSIDQIWHVSISRPYRNISCGRIWSQLLSTNRQNSNTTHRHIKFWHLHVLL